MPIPKLVGPSTPVKELKKGCEVVNLSNTFIPSREQLQLLNKGLTFIPTPKINNQTKKELTLDLQRYHRRLLLTAFFRNKEENTYLPFTHKSTWTPKLIQVPDTVRKIIRADKYALKNLPWMTERPPNLNWKEKQALIQLRRDRKIVIKPADKGSATVIMAREAYIREAYRQLDQTEYYKKLKDPIFPETVKKVIKIISQLHEKGFVNKKQMTYLLPPENPRARIFYLLPKIHKDPKSWSVPYQMPPGRPIVSDCDSDTYATAEYIEYYLNPISTKHPSYIKDTYDFISKITQLRLPQDCLLFTIDIDSLYTNIETKAGLAAVQEFFSKYPDKHRPEKEILQLLEINLTRNDFQFNSEWFLQIKGTAMGKRFAPSYANIFMAKWEEGALDSHPIKPLHYYRFLDDIWGVWSGTVAQFEDFTKHLNTFHSSIRIKYTLHHREVNFLDTVTFKGDDFQTSGQLQTRVFFKDTDTHALLHKTSFHPKHTFRGIIKSQLYRFDRISSQPEDFRKATQILFKKLRKRGYSRSFLRICLNKFRRGGHKATTPVLGGDIIPFVTTFSDYSLRLNRRIKENFSKFISSGTILKNHRVISAYRRNKNLRDLLIASKLPPLQTNVKQPKPMSEFKPKRFLVNPKSKQIFELWPPLNQEIGNCVYLVYCERCNAQYVGETGNRLRYRMYQHKYNITHKKETQTRVVRHFVRHGLGSLRVMGLQQGLSWTSTKRKKMERAWIEKLGSTDPWGLNEK